MRVLIAAACLCLWTAPARADTINVDPGMTQGQIQAAINGAADGDTVKFAKGVYKITSPIVVSTAGVTLKGSKAVIDGQYITSDGLVASADNVTITGFIVFNTNADGIRVEALEEGTLPDGVEISKNQIESCKGDGIEANGSNLLIEKNRCGGNNGDGIDVDDTTMSEGLVTATTVIKGNQCAANGGNGIQAQIFNRLVLEKNTCTGNDDDGIEVEVNPEGEGKPAPPEPSGILKNKCLANGGNGIWATQNSGDCLLVEKNTTAGNMQNGILAVGDDLMILSNKSSRNVGQGIRAEVTNSQIDKNKVELNRSDGLHLRHPGTESLSGFNSLDGNFMKANGRDGLELHSGDNTATNNKCQFNGGDGIDVNPGHANNRLENNTCNKNGHEGIDNGGVATDIVGNKCKDNANEIGPDIAGTGDGGVGSVDEFVDNTFETGGPDEPARLDSPGDP